MRSLLFGFALLAASLWMTAEAQAQVVYYGPAPYVTYQPVVAYGPAITTYRPVGPVYAGYPAPVYAPPVRAYRPGVVYYSGYGGYEVRRPGQPVRNFFRAVVP